MAKSGRLKSPLQLPGMGHGSEIWDDSLRIRPAEIAFGPIDGAVIDDLVMGRAGPGTSSVR